MPALPPDRSFLLWAALGALLALAGVLPIRAGAAASDAGPALLAIVVIGIAVAMFSLAAPAARLLMRGWRRVGIGPRDPGRAGRAADGLTVAVWLLWLIGLATTLPDAWGPMLAYLGRG